MKFECPHFLIIYLYADRLIRKLCSRWSRNEQYLTEEYQLKLKNYLLFKNINKMSDFSGQELQPTESS